MRIAKIIFVLLFVLCTPLLAQESYEDVLTTYLATNPSGDFSSANLLKPSLYAINQRALKDFTKKKSDELVNTYLSQQWKKDVISGLKKIYEKHVSIDELKELTTLLSSKEGKSFLQKNEQLTDMTFKDASQLTENFYKAFVAHKKPKAVQIDKSCPIDYAELFDAFYEAFNFQELFEMGMNISKGKGNDSNEDSLVTKKCIEYVLTNMKNMTLNNSYKLISKEELLLGTQIGQTTGWKHQLAAINEMTENPQFLGKYILERYINWLSKQKTPLSKQ